MRLGVMTDKIHPGSTPKVIGLEVRYLREIGQQAEAISILEGIPGGDQYRDYLQGQPIRFLSSEASPLFKKLNFKFPFFAFFSTFHLLAPYFASSVVKRGEYDAIISHATYTCLTARRISKNSGIPYFAFIWDPIDYILRKCYGDKPLRHFFPALLPLGGILDSYVTNGSMAVITCSNLHVEYLRTKTNRPIEIVYPGCEPIDKIPGSRGDYILAVDRWDLGNSPHKLLGMMKLLPKNAKLVVVGFWYPESLRTSFESQIKAEGLADQVEARGPANREQLKALYSQARVLVHPNEEVFGFVPHEAASCGCPIIMPGTSGNCEVYKHGIHGFFPPKFDTHAFAEYAGRLVADERLAWKMGEAAWIEARKHTWKDHTLRLNEIVTKYIGPR